MVVEDEMSLVQEHNPYYRWSVKGTTPKVKFIRERESAQIFFGGLSLKDKREIIHLSENKKSADFIEFLEAVKKRYCKEIELRLEAHREWLKTQEDYHGLILVVVDGASIHKSEETKIYLEQNYGIFELMRFPTYAPEVNPQEHVWKALRADLAKVAHQYTFEEILNRACRFLLTNTFKYKFGKSA